jgi:hypothetical protein
MVLHNTIIAENGNPAAFSNAHFRNNLFLGTDSPGRPISRFPNASSYSTYDYNGYRPNKATEVQYEWKAPGDGVSRDYQIDRKDFERFATLAEFSEATGNERNGIEVGYDIFQSLEKPDPKKPHAVYQAEKLDFKLKDGCSAVDADVLLPNVNNEFAGTGPDLGALEVGEPVPIYGPRDKGQ